MQRPEIIEYGICSSPNYEELAGLVNVQIKLGWQPHHPVFVSMYCSTQHFHQAMVLYKKSVKKRSVAIKK